MIIDEIKKANMQALKAHEDQKRIAYTLVMNKHIMLKTSAEGKEVTDADMVSILQKAIKELDEEQESYEKAGRAESVAEIKIQKDALSAFLPHLMGKDEIKQIILGLEDKSIGSVMKHFKTNFAGKVDMKAVQEVLKSL